MFKKILVLFGVLLLVINIAVAAATFSKDAYLKKINRMLDKAAAYTSISNTERAEYLKAADIFADAFEKCIKSITDDEMIANEIFIKAIDEAWNSLERDLDDPNYSASYKAQFIKSELKEKNFLQMGCHGGGLDISTNNKTSTGGNYSPARKSYQCEIGHNIEGLCVYPLRSYKVSEDIAKRNCGNYNMTFATREQVKMLSEHGDAVYQKHSDDIGTIFPNGVVSGIDTTSHQSYVTVLCVKDNNNTTTTGGNYSPARKSYQCEIGHNIEGLCVYPLRSYKVSEDIAKRNCGNYNMAFATREQVKMLSEHGDAVYQKHSDDIGTIFPNGVVSGIDTTSHQSYVTVLCVKDNNNTTTTGGNYSPARKSYQCEIGHNIEGLCVYPLRSYKVSEDIAKRNCGNYNMTFATREQVKMLSEHGDAVYQKHSDDIGTIFPNGVVSGIDTTSHQSYVTVLCVKDNNNTTTTGGNYTPIQQKSYQCEVGQYLEGMCAYALLTYDASDNVAKSRCSKYGMSFATREQVNKLSKHADLIYRSSPGDTGSLFFNGIISGLHLNTSERYYVVLCVK